MSSTLKPSPVSSANDESAPEASDPEIVSVAVRSLQIDDRTLCIVLSGGRAFIPLGCFLEWSTITEQKVKSTLEHCGIEMSELTAADDDIQSALEDTSHHSEQAFTSAERLLPLEGAIAYLKILGKVYEATTLGDYLLKEGLLPPNSRILLSG